MMQCSRFWLTVFGARVWDVGLVLRAGVLPLSGCRISKLCLSAHPMLSDSNMSASCPGEDSAISPSAYSWDGFWIWMQGSSFSLEFMGLVGDLGFRV